MRGVRQTDRIDRSSITLVSAFGPKRRSLAAPHMSAFGGKADMTVCGCLLSRSLLGVKRTWALAPHTSAFDPKRTFLLCGLRRILATFLASLTNRRMGWMEFRHEATSFLSAMRPRAFIAVKPRNQPLTVLAENF